MSEDNSPENYSTKMPVIADLLLTDTCGDDFLVNAFLIATANDIVNDGKHNYTELHIVLNDSETKQFNVKETARHIYQARKQLAQRLGLAL